MARKAPTFDQLAAYIARDAGPNVVGFARNLHHGGGDRYLVARQFLQNHRHLPKRKNGNALYHEVIVLEPQPHLDAARVNDALLALAEAYCAVRAPGQLAWGRVHRNTAHPHIHLMISSNAVRSSKRARLERSAFAKIQRDLEAFRAREFPELRDRAVYAPEHIKETPRMSRDQGEAVRRTGQASVKQAAFDTLQPIFDAAAGKAELEVRLADTGFALYKRGRSWGVIDGAGRRYRLQTLGLGPAFDQVLQRSSEQRAKDAAGVPTEVPLPPSHIADPVDARADALIAARNALAHEAEQQLDDFERDQDSQR